MAVQVWIGEKPENPNERKAIIALATGLDRLDGLYLMLANFSVGGHTIDLVILKNDAIFILELKHCDGRVSGGVNGPWIVTSKSGSTKHLNPGRKNPYNQVIAYFYSFTNFLNDNKNKIVSTQKAPDIDFRTAKRVIVIVPTIEPDSEIELDWKVQVKGLDELPTYLVVERSAGIELSDQAMERIPRLLRCTPWQELQDLLAGVMPDWETTPSEPVAPVRPPVPEPTVVEPPVAPRSLRQRIQGWTAGVLTAFGVATLIYAVAVRAPSQPLTPLPAAINPAATAAPIPTIPEEGLPQSVSDGIASVHQRVPRKWDGQSQKWSLARSADDADVLLTLETVDFNNGEIKLTWTVENRQATTLYMPFSASNFDLTDGSLQYGIDESRSQPAKLYVKPGAKETATLVVSQPVRPSALTLKVTVLQYPFGKATWLVQVPQVDR